MYLVEKTGKAPRPSADKSALKRMVLEYWGVSGNQTSDDYKDPPTPPMQRTPPTQRTTPMPRSTPTPLNAKHRNMTCNQNYQEDTTQEQPQSQNTSVDSKDEVQLLAEQFVAWFYQLWNSQNPHFQMGNSSQWGPQHFFVDSELKVCYVQQQNVENFKGNTEVCNGLFLLVNREQLLFNHHTIKAMDDPYGCVVVMVAGTVHNKVTSVGTFEHMFVLFRDPLSQNNWKIKSLELRLKVQTLPQFGMSSNKPLQYR